MGIIGSGRSRIFLEGGAPTPKVGVLASLFAENWMKMKEFGPRGRGTGARPWQPLGSANDKCNN